MANNTVFTCSGANQILASLLRGESQLRPNVLYVEFQTGPEKVDPLPETDPNDKDYYLRLRANSLSDRDFLRIPVASITPITGDNPDKLTLAFNGICIGGKGVGGKSTSNSIIYGMALVASPTYGTGIDDLTRDVIWARGYYAPEYQIRTSSSAQTAITFKLNLQN